MMEKYPFVAGEFITLSHLVANKMSITRHGDGEFKMIEGNGYRREVAKSALTEMLSWAFRANLPNCLTAVPTLDPAGPKYNHWARSEKRFLRHLEPGRQYYSAFISRPDSAPWINTPEYASLMQQLWLDKKVAVLCEQDGSALRATRIGAKSVTHIRCPTHEAFGQLNRLENQILDAAPDIAILSCGPTASIMAVRLAQLGLQAIDFGSGGSFIAKLLSPK